MRRVALAAGAAFLLSAFRFGSVELGRDAAVEVESEAADRAAAAVVPKGDRRLALSVGPAQDNDFDAAFTLAKNAGIDSTSLTVFWDDIETSSSPVEHNPLVNYLAIANAYYPARGADVILVIAVVDTVARRMPADLMGLAYDDPAVITRFRLLLDYVFSQIPDLRLVALSIGNEVDGVLATPAEWTQYRNFFEDAAVYARQKRPGLVVGVKATHGALTSTRVNELKALNSAADAVFATYYPLNGDFTVRDAASPVADMDALCALYPGTRIDFLEAGYPSGAPNLSSDARQAEFIRHLFRAWDRRAEQVKTVNIVTLTEPSPSTLSDWEIYYGINDPAFLSFLGTLGLRTYAGSGESKPAFSAFSEEAHRRGW